MAWQDVLPLVLRSVKGVPLDATDMDLNFTLIGQMLCDLVAGHDHDGVNSKAIPIEVTIDNFPDATIIGGKLQSSDWGASAGTQIDLLNKTMMFGGSAAPKFSVNAAGVLTARDALLSGAITASTIDIGGTDATSLHVDVNGNLWSGAATFAAAPFRVSYAGAMRALNGEFTGTITASTFRTAASGARIEINVAGGIQAWNADPVQTVDINVDGSGWFGLTSARAIQWTAAGVVKVGGFTATATTLSDTASGKTVLMSIGATAFAAGTTGAPEFYVTSAGALVATNATIGGAIVGATIDIGGADATSFHVDAGGNLWSGAATYADAPFRVSDAGELTALSATISGNITATAGTIGGFTIDPTEGLYVGSAGTRIQLKAGTGIWLGATAFASAPFSVSPAGSLIAQTGTVGGFTIDAIHGLYAGSGVTRVQMKPGAGIWAGATAIGDAPFSVTPAGALVAANANVAGTITATAGTIGGFTVNATDGLYAGSGATLVQMKPGAGIWAGATAIGDAPFSVTQAGVLKAVSGTIGGNVLATTYIQSASFLSGPLGYGWRISSTGDAEFQNVSIRGIFKSAVFEMDTVSAVNGMLMVSKGDTLAADMTAADSSALIIAGATAFSVGEVLRIKDGTDDEWLLVTDATYAPTYTVTRDLAGAYGANANPAWKRGAAVVSMGCGSGTKTGYISLDASSGNSPFIDVYGRNSTVYTDVTLHGRFGWLKGITDADVGLSGTDVWGLYTDAAYIKGVIVANTGRIGGSSGWVISSKSIKDASGLVGLSADVTAGDDIRFWAGHATPASAPFSVTEAGVLKASSGTVGGFTLSATALYAGSAATRIQLDTTAGLWLGATAFASAPFRVSLAGALTAQGATIQSAASGARIVLNSTGLAIYDASAQRAAILATGAGWLGSTTTFAWTTAGVVTAGGWTINSVALFKDSGSDATSSGLAPADYPFYAGKQYSGRATAPFRVTPAGILTATGANISGTITATAGTIGGFVIGANYIRDIGDTFGMTTYDTGTNEEVRIWSGASFANRETAPFAVWERGDIVLRSTSYPTERYTLMRQYEWEHVGDYVQIIYPPTTHADYPHKSMDVYWNYRMLRIKGVDANLGTSGWGGMYLKMRHTEMDFAIGGMNGNFSNTEVPVLIVQGGDSPYAYIDGGFHVGGTSNPGDDNLLVDGRILASGQPMFKVGTATQSNVTGDGTGLNVPWSEITDQGSCFVTSRFTAPVAGKYQFNLTIQLQGITAAHSLAQIRMVINGSDHLVWMGNPYYLSYSGDLIVSGSVCTAMAASGTAYVNVSVYNGTKVVDIGPNSYFSGFLIAA